MKRKHALALVAVVTFLATVAWTASKQVLVLKDGRRILGEVTSSKSGYQVKIGSGAVAVFSADQVLRVEDVVTPAEELKKRLAKIDQTNADQLYRVARWASDRGLLAEAKGLLLKARKTDPKHENAKLLLRLVEMRLKAATRTAATASTRILVAPRTKFNFLKPEDIYRIRLAELKKTDRAVIQYRNKVLDRFIKWMRGRDIFDTPDGERRFRGATKVAQVQYIQQKVDRESPMLDDILVKSDPVVIKTFRTKIWPIVSKNCAVPSCHGGVEGAAGLKLYDVPLKDERALYTNFYILHKWSKGGRRLINRDNHEMSLLLQYGLPQKLARLPHPKRLDTIYRTKQDPSYRIVEGWIETLRFPFLRPGYRIKYTLPGQAPVPTTSTAPAPAPK